MNQFFIASKLASVPYFYQDLLKDLAHFGNFASGAELSLPAGVTVDMSDE